MTHLSDKFNYLRLLINPFFFTFSQRKFSSKNTLKISLAICINFFSHIHYHREYPFFF